MLLLPLNLDRFLRDPSLPVSSCPDQRGNFKLELYLQIRAEAAWPQLAGLHVRHRDQYAYVEGELADGECLKLIRLRYTGTASRWDFALHDPASDRYQDALLPTGSHSGTPEDALDTACHLHLTALNSWVRARRQAAPKSTPEGFTTQTT